MQFSDIVSNWNLFLQTTDFKENKCVPIFSKCQQNSPHKSGFEEDCRVRSFEAYIWNGKVINILMQRHTQEMGRASSRERAFPLSRVLRVLSPISAKSKCKDSLPHLPSVEDCVFQYTLAVVLGCSSGSSTETPFVMSCSAKSYFSHNSARSS